MDLIIHDAKTLFDFDRRLKAWNLQWRVKGRTRFNDCHLIGDDPRNIRVDVFKATPFEEWLWKGPRMHGVDIVKAVPTKGWLPSVLYILHDKLLTIPKRARDRDDKRLKDFIDVHNLVFHNRHGISARDLADATPTSRTASLAFLGAARAHDKATRRGTYAQTLDALEPWWRS